MKGVVIGRLRNGGVRMRGIPVAEAYGFDRCDVCKLPDKTWDVGLLVKYHCDRHTIIRRRVGRLIYDPLDCWMSTEPNASPESFWRARYSELRFDDILAATPSAAVSMRESLPSTVNVWLVPHHADPHHTIDWKDDRGPVVYAGGAKYLGRWIEEIAEACKRLGRKLKVADGDSSIDGLRGASLALALRLPPTDTDLNRIAKPQVKLENAAAVGLPVLASNHPCITSLRPECVVTHNNSEWDELIAMALHSRPLRHPFAQKHYLKRIGEIIYG